MNKKLAIAHILQSCSKEPKHEIGTFFAPSNIALCKYWGKRDTELNLPNTASLSISLGDLGARTTLSLNSKPVDVVFVNGKEFDKNTAFVKNLLNFLDYFRSYPEMYFIVKTEVNIPIGAGLASSACGFAALVGALDALFGWDLSTSQLSLLARMGSGSASRSFWHGFVEWEMGIREDGMDSVGVPLNIRWPELRIGLLILNAQQKILSSREAMQRTVLTSPFYSVWPNTQDVHLLRLKNAIETRNFLELGETSEINALAMHALMLTACPPILYSNPATLEAMHKIWQCRQQGLSLFFTQDAGPNLKLLFLHPEQDAIVKFFPDLNIIAPFMSRG